MNIKANKKEGIRNRFKIKPNRISCTEGKSVERAWDSMGLKINIGKSKVLKFKKD